MLLLKKYFEKSNSPFWGSLFWSVVIFLGFLSIWANSDLLGPRGFLFMDEKFIVDYVKNILDAPTFGKWWYAVADGDDHRYGRILYYLAAILAAWPYSVFGEPGLIFSIRMSCALFMLAAFCVLCLGLLKTWPARVYAILLLGSLPFTAYYMTMPKPEPVQILMLAIFTTLAIRKKFCFGWHWIFLGVAYGTKISAAPFCLAVGLLGFLASFLNRLPVKKMGEGAFVSALSFAAGFLIAVPFLIHPKPKNIDSYLQWTWKGTGHGDDNSNVSWKTWLSEITSRSEVTNYYYNTHTLSIISIIFCGFGLILVLQGLKKSQQEDNQKNTLPLILFFLSFSLLLPILFAVKRLWGIYLYAGQVFFVLAIGSLIESTWQKSIQKNKLDPRSYFIKIATFSLLICVLTSWPKVYSGYHSLANRTKNEDHIIQAETYYNVYKKIKSIELESRKDRGSGKLEVYYDPFLYFPESNEQINFKPFWSYEVPWSQKPDVVVMDYNQTLAYLISAKNLPPPTQSQYSMLLTAKKQFAKSVSLEKENSSAEYALEAEKERYGIITKKTLLKNAQSKY